MADQNFLSRLKEDGVEHLWITYTDYGGRTSGKTVPARRFADVLDYGLNFTPANFTAAMNNSLPPAPEWDASSGDVMAIPDPDSYVLLPYRHATARTHAWMRDVTGAPWDGCPRTRLERMFERYAEDGLSVQTGFEAECQVVAKTGPDQYDPVEPTPMFDARGLDRHYDLWRTIVETLEGMGINVWQVCKEGGPGQYELNLEHATGMKAVDDYLTMRAVVGSFVHDAGFIVTYMPKLYSDRYGNGLHLHMSLWDSDGKQNLTRGEGDQPLSSLASHFAAGLLHHAPAIAAVSAPIVNSYKRLLPGTWAPAHISWAVGNRSALIRVPDLERRRHVEFRLGDNACNPYMYLTAVLAAGLDGIRNQIDLPEPFDGVDLGALSDDEAAARGAPRLPRCLPEAHAALEQDEVIIEAIGDTILSTFLQVKRLEMNQHNLHVHAFERAYYLENLG